MLVRVILQMSLFLVANCGSIVVAFGEPGGEGKFSSDEYESVVQDVVRLLTQGKEDQFRALLSPSLIRRSEAQLGKKKVDQMIKEQFIPFFSTFHHLTPNVNSTKTTDGDKNSGLAIFRSFIDEDGAERPFVVYVVKEGEKLVVGNLLVNRTLRDMSLLDSKSLTK